MKAAPGTFRSGGVLGRWGRLPADQFQVLAVDNECFVHIVSELFHRGSPFFHFGLSPADGQIWELGLYPTVSISNVHASFSDGLADSFEQLLHSAHLLLLLMWRVLY